MPRKKSHATIQRELVELLAPSFPGIEIEVGHSDRWDRACLTFRWEGFAGTLPEERFRRLVLCIPEEYRERHLGDAVWLELAPGESIDDYLALPRSEDIAEKEQAIRRRLAEAGFFDALLERLAPMPLEQTVIDLSSSRQVLRAKGFSADQARDACLLFLRHGAYCDCEVWMRARPAILGLEEAS